MTTPSIVLLIVLGGVVVAGCFVDNLPRAYRERSCLGAQWRRRFPNASKQSIRQFLHFFASAFAIKPKHALRFGPDDELMVIYKAHNPSQLMPDVLEFETLSMRLEKEHQFSLMSVWHEHLTLGELFSKLSAAQPAVPPDAPAAASRRQGRG
jgi:hypothetical protein